MSKVALCLPRHFAPSSVLLALQERSCRFIKAERDIRAVFRMAGLFSTLKLRSACETDETWLQLLPYARLVDASTECVFFYERGANGVETRLHGDWSVGLGGHVEETPVDPSIAGANALFKETLIREIQEEVGLSGLEQLDFQASGLIVDGSNPVGRVHLGIAYEVRLPEPVDKLALEPGVIINGTWESPSLARISGVYQKLENWSKVFMAEHPSNYIKASHL